MHSFDSQENDKEERLPGWENEKASDNLLSSEAKRKLESFKVPKEKGDEVERDDDRADDGRDN